MGLSFFVIMRLGITGHRTFKDINPALSDRVWDILRGADIVYTGMALGFDTFIADLCYDHGIPFIACIPFIEQDAMWSDADKAHYVTLLAAAKEIVFMASPGYAAWKYMKRNKYIVDNTDMMLAYWDGKKLGGTYQCVSYAKAQGRKVINVY